MTGLLREGAEDLQAAANLLKPPTSPHSSQLPPQPSVSQLKTSATPMSQSSKFSSRKSKRNIWIQLFWHQKNCGMKWSRRTLGWWNPKPCGAKRAKSTLIANLFLPDGKRLQRMISRGYCVLLKRNPFEAPSLN